MGDWFREWCTKNHVPAGKEFYVCEDCKSAYSTARIRKQRAGEVCPFCLARLDTAVSR